MAKFIVNQHETRVPTLLIGIGGIGGRILSDVYDQLSKYDKKYIKMIVMDTDTNALSGFEEKGISVIQTSEKKNVASYLEDHHEYLEWFPTNPFVNAKNLTDGAGQIRAVSRLGALASAGNGKFEKIKTAIYELNKNHGDGLVKTLKVMIVGSITGGTGSGLGIQLPFYIRKVIGEDSASPDILIRGLFLTPDLTVKVQEKEGNKKAMYVNGYAFLRELNAFYKAQGLKDEDIKIDVEYYDKGKHNEGKIDELKSANQIPYNFMFLLESTDKDGANLGELESYEKQAAKIIKNQIFSPITPTQYSAEDNLIIDSIENKGMDRYCGAGYAALRYPKDEILKYCTLKFCENTIKDYWLYFDRKFELDNNIQKANMAHDRSLRLLSRDTHYISNFGDMTRDIDAPVEIACLASETIEEFVIKDDITEEKKTLQREVLDIVTTGIEDSIEEALMDPRFTEGFADSDFSLDAALMKKPELAQAEVIRVLDLLVEYETKTRKVISETFTKCAGKILPGSVEAAKGIKLDAACCLYGRLKRMHPLTARYILYQMHDWVVEEKKIADGMVAENTKSRIAEDYDVETEVKESAPEAISSIATHSWYKRILDILTGKYSDLTERIEKDINNEKTRINEFRTYKFKSSVYGYLSASIEKLIDVYEGFFDGLKDVVKENAHIVKMFEEREDIIVNGERLVCADGSCVKALYKEIEDKAIGEMMSISPEVKADLFEKFYMMYEDLPVRDKYTEGDKMRLKDASAYFKTSIFPNMEKDVISRGDDIINMSIFDAIEKEYEVYSKQKKDIGEVMEMTSDQYISYVMGRVANLAKPYISYSCDANVVAYWGLNRSAAIFFQKLEGGKSDDSLLKKKLGITDVGNSIVLDSAFSPYEIVCYKVVHGLLIGNLNKYKKGNTCYTEYVKRLDNVIESMAKISKDETGALSTTHPHIDKRWHNIAYLPWLDEKENVEANKDNLCAFLVGCGLDMFKYESWDYSLSWLFDDGMDVYPVKVNGEILKDRSYYLLFESLSYNKVIKDVILKKEKELRSTDKRAMVLEDTGVTDYDKLNMYFDALKAHTIIKILTGEIASKKCSNIVDMICDIRYAEGESTFINELIQYTCEYIKDYCMEMTNKQPGLSDELYRMITKDICLNSKKLKTTTYSLKKRIFNAFSLKEEDIVTVTKTEADEASAE